MNKFSDYKTDHLEKMIDALYATLQLHVDADTSALDYIGYKQVYGIECPLCNQFRGDCTRCPWILFEDRTCYCYDNPERIDQIQNWIDQLKVEIARRKLE